MIMFGNFMSVNIKKINIDTFYPFKEVIIGLLIHQTIKIFLPEFSLGNSSNQASKLKPSLPYFQALEALHCCWHSRILYLES